VSVVVKRLCRRRCAAGAGCASTVLEWTEVYFDTVRLLDPFICNSFDLIEDTD